MTEIEGEMCFTDADFHKVALLACVGYCCHYCRVSLKAMKGLWLQPGQVRTGASGQV